MVSLKCKMCGGDLELITGENICECQYCGSRQTVPDVDDDRKAKLYERANKLRFNCDFDKAASVYENIINEFPDDAEGYWGLVLCNYGIEYVDDPATRKKVPTCHRSSFESLMDDPDFEMVMENSEDDVRALYRQEAKQIEEIRRGIIEISGKEQPYDIFICYKETDKNGERTIDSVLAQDVYDALTQKGYRVFFSRISLEDKLGTEYEPYIFAALNSAKIMLAFGTSYDNYNAVWVKNEWGRFLKLMASDKEKYLIPCYKDIDAYDIPKEFAKFQAQDLGKVGATQDLLRGIDKILSPADSKQEAQQAQPSASFSNTDSAAPLLKRAFMFLEDGNFKEADDYCERVLDLNPENAQAYLGKLMAELQVRKQEDLKNCAEPFDDRSNYKKMLRFGDDKLAENMAGYNQFIRERNENAKKEAVYQQACYDMEESTEGAYTEAMNRFRSIPNYKDSNKLVTVCGQKIQELKEKAEAARIEAEKKAEATRLETEKKADVVIESLERHLAQAHGSSLQTQLEKQEQKFARLKQIQEILPGLLKEKATNEQMLGNVEKAISELQGKRQSLGLFARKEKVDIDTQLRYANEERNKIMKANLEIEEKTDGCFSVSKVEKEIDICKKRINKIKLMMQKVDFSSAMSFEEAVRSLSNPSIREAVLNKLADLETRLYIALAGDEVVFGDYYGPIEWLVKARNENQLLLVSKYALDTFPYDKDRGCLTWEKCMLRHWLNEAFLKEAFSMEEQELIISTNVTAEKNQKYNIDAGNDTQDKVFLLSIFEVDRYFDSAEARKCALTDYAKTKGAYISNNYKTVEGKNTCHWWLRTPGSSAINAAYVDCGGSVNSYGRNIDCIDYCVRPALWLELDNIQ